MLLMKRSRSGAIKERGVMNTQEIALEFLSYFCSGDLESMSDLLDDDFHFKGPLVECHSKEAYIDSLNDNPPIDCNIEVIKTFEDGDETCILYTFNKPNITTPMAQYFKFHKDKITETLLIFDTSVFGEDAS